MFSSTFAGGLQRQDSLENVLVEGQDTENKLTSAAPVTDKPVKEEWAIMVDVTEPVLKRKYIALQIKVHYFTVI